MTLLIAGTIRIDAARLDMARPAMARMIAASRAEDGCLAYSYAQDVLDPGLIHVAEEWRDQGALDRHFASAHIATWRAAGAELGIRDRSLQLYEASEARSI